MRVSLDTKRARERVRVAGICADLLELILLEHDLVVGQNVLRELRKALRAKVKLPVACSAEIVEFVAGEAAAVIEGAQPIEANVDADNALVLGEALRGQAEMFVTGDAALLKLGTVQGLEIASPRQFWEALHAGRQ